MWQTLDGFLAGQQDRGAIPAGVATVLTQIAGACTRISKIVAMGAIAHGLGSAGRENVQQEEQKKLDLITIELSSVPAEATAYLLLFDPLDGSSNIDVNVSVGGQS